MRVVITFQPLTQWPANRPRTAVHVEAKFESRGQRTSLARTRQDLDRELAMIKAKDVVIQIDAHSRFLRADGELLQNAPTSSPAVVLTFKRDGAALEFACDRFQRFQDNIRAITLGLESLRKIERYHIGSGTEQYRGWLALPASTTPTLSTDNAALAIARRLGGTVTDLELARTAAQILADKTFALNAVRQAVFTHHPDRRNGARAEFDIVQEAKRILESYHGGSL